MNQVSILAAGQCPEAEFLLQCLRTPDTAGETRLARLLQSNLDWNRILTWGRSQAVLPLLYDRLKASHWERIPPGPRSELENFFQKNAARNLGTAAELIEILRVCREQSLEVVPFKGVVLARQLYGNYALRVVNDLDLLVHFADVHRLRELLARRGYAARVPLSDCYNQELLRSEGQLPLSQKNRPWVVELHTSLLHGPDSRMTSLDALQSRCENREFGGQPIRSLSREDTLLYLAAHGAKHWWERLGWICDVAQLIRTSPDLDWERTGQRARELHWERTYLLGLALARDLLAAAVPEQIDTLQPVVEQLAENVARKLFASSAIKTNSVQRLRFQLRCRERQRDRIWLIWYTCLRPTIADWQAVSLPRSVSRLHYLFRPVRLVGKYSTQWLRRLWTSTVRPKEIK